MNRRNYCRISLCRSSTCENISVNLL